MKKWISLLLMLSLMGGCGAIGFGPALSSKDVGIFLIPDADVGPRWRGAEPILVLGEGKRIEKVKIGEIAASWKVSILNRLKKKERMGLLVQGVEENGLELLRPDRFSKLEEGVILLWRVTLGTKKVLSGEVGRIISVIKARFRAIRVPSGETIFKAEYEEMVPVDTDGKRARGKLEEIGRDIAGSLERDMFGKGIKISTGVGDEPIWKDGARVIAVLPLASRHDPNLEQNPGWLLFKSLGGSEEELRRYGEDALVESLKDTMRFYVIAPSSIKSMLPEGLAENIERISDISEAVRDRGVDLMVMGWVSPGMGWFNIMSISSPSLKGATMRISPSIEINVSVLDPSSNKAVMSRTFEGVSGKGALPIGGDSGTIVIGTRMEDEVAALIDGIREASLKASSSFIEALSSSRRKVVR